MTSINTAPTPEEQSNDIVVHAINGDLHVIPRPQKHQTDKGHLRVSHALYPKEVSTNDPYA